MNGIHNPLRLFIISSLSLLLATVVLGLLASWAFLFPEIYNRYLPFYELRPFHVSSALFWIITGASAAILFYRTTEFKISPTAKLCEQAFVFSWVLTIIAIFGCYALKKFGGREYWEFPPVLCVPLLISWLFFVVSFFAPLMRKRGKQPMYVWMWATGIFFFLITFVEQNLWQIPWFRSSYLKEITVQWKANGATVGAWNQMIYGTSLYLMVKISGDKRIAEGRMVFFFYFLSLTNLMFNWGHHIYNVPSASWIRDTSYVISMTEWIFLIKMIHGFRNTLAESKKLKHLLTYRFIMAAEFWVFMNLLLTLAMSVPAINRFTHGTHITVAHAMGATIGINSMILLASFTYLLGIEQQTKPVKKIININYWITQGSLTVFWLSLIGAGIVKGYRNVYLNLSSFQEIMQPAIPFLKLFSFAGIGLLAGLGTIATVYIYHGVYAGREALSMRARIPVAAE